MIITERPSASNDVSTDLASPSTTGPSMISRPGAVCGVGRRSMGTSPRALGANWPPLPARPASALRIVLIVPSLLAGVHWRKWAGHRPRGTPPGPGSTQHRAPRCAVRSAAEGLWGWVWSGGGGHGLRGDLLDLVGAAPGPVVVFGDHHGRLHVAQRLHVGEGLGVFGDVDGLVGEIGLVQGALGRIALHAQGLRVHGDGHRGGASLSDGAVPGSPAPGVYVREWAAAPRWCVHAGRRTATVGGAQGQGPGLVRLSRTAIMVAESSISCASISSRQSLR